MFGATALTFPFQNIEIGNKYFRIEKKELKVESE